MLGTSRCLFVLPDRFLLRKAKRIERRQQSVHHKRVGDIGFIIGLMVMFVYLGSFDFETVFKAVRNDDGSMKTAQTLPISTFWLTVARYWGVSWAV